MNLKPFVKWAGGKTQLLETIKTLLPDANQINNYFEPFLGGGALLLSLRPKKAFVSDINYELICTWNTIRDHKNLLVEKLQSHIKNHNQFKKNYYLKVRNEKIENLSQIEIAARFIYLNKTGFNGLYRVNRKNEFNVPYGQKNNLKESSVFSSENINNISQFLAENKIEIHCLEYKDLLKSVQANDFVFVDPPYDSDTNIFDAYNPNSFGKQGQIELFKVLDDLTSKKVRWMLTNHDTNLINELYKKYDCYKIIVNRAINSRGNERKNATQETIFVNYPITNQQKKGYQVEKFLKGLQGSSYILEEYVSWKKINDNIDKNGLFLNDLNLFFNQNSELEIFNILDVLFESEERRKSLSLLPLLLGKRLKNKENFIYFSRDNKITKYDWNNKLIVKEFIVESGLINNVFLNKKYKDWNSYILGLEVGLSTNDKKNKSGNFATDYITNIFKKYDIPYSREVNYDLVLNMSLKDNKKFDFVFALDGITYCVECNFYNGGGSKINSEIKRFITLNETFENYVESKFIWITDGPGLKTVRKPLTVALEKIKLLFNLNSFEEFIKNKQKAIKLQQKEKYQEQLDFDKILIQNLLERNIKKTNLKKLLQNKAKQNKNL